MFHHEEPDKQFEFHDQNKVFYFYRPFEQRIA